MTENERDAAENKLALTAGEWQRARQRVADAKIKLLTAQNALATEEESLRKAEDKFRAAFTAYVGGDNA